MAAYTMSTLRTPRIDDFCKTVRDQEERVLAVLAATPFGHLQRRAIALLLVLLPATACFGQLPPLPPAPTSEHAARAPVPSDVSALFPVLQNRATRPRYSLEEFRASCQIGPSDGMALKLRKARLAWAHQEVEAASAAYQAGTTPLDDLFKSQQRWCEAGLLLATDDRQELALLESRFCDAVRTAEIVKAKAEMGIAGGSVKDLAAAMSNAFRAAADLWEKEATVEAAERRDSPTSRH